MEEIIFSKVDEERANFIFVSFVYELLLISLVFNLWDVLKAQLRGQKTVEKIHDHDKSETHDYLLKWEDFFNDE